MAQFVAVRLKCPHKEWNRRFLSVVRKKDIHRRVERRLRAERCLAIMADS
jgi:hypothetical protein